MSNRGMSQNMSQNESYIRPRAGKAEKPGFLDVVTE